MNRTAALLLAPVAALLGAGDAPAPVELKGHTALVYGVALSPDGKLLASAGFDNAVKLWDLAAAKELKTFAGHTGPVYSVAWSPDGTLLASSSLDQTVRVWNVAEGKQVGAEIKGHAGIVDSVAWSPDGKTLATGSADKTVRLWNAADGKEIKNLGGHLGTVHAVAWSADGKLLASASAEPAAKAPGSDVLVKIWDVAGQKELKAIKGHEIAATGVAFSPDGTQLYSIGFDKALHVWDVASGNEVKKLQREGKDLDDLYGLAVSKDGKTVAVSGYGGYLTVWNVAEGKALASKKVKYGAYCVAFAPDGKTLITGHDDHIIYLTPMLQ